MKIKAAIPLEKLIKPALENMHIPIDLDVVAPRTMVAFPGGVEKRTTTIHKLGDYFDAIVKEPVGENLNLVFYVKSDRPKHDPSYWKDLMLRIVWAHTGRKYFPQLEKG